MNPEIKQRWITALRSGDYPQTRGALHRVEETMEDQVGYCCLGVLCDIASKDDIVSVVETINTKEYYGSSDVSLSGAYLVSEVMDWADLPLSDGVSLSGSQINPYLTDEDSSDDVYEDTRYYSLADLNDNGVSFNTIAKLIEVYL